MVERKPIMFIEFNDAQKAAMSAALMAAADEIVEPSAKVKKRRRRKPPLRAGDIIELTDSEEDADSDDSSDCEITGFVTLDTNQPVAEADVKLQPPVVKVEIKEELVQLPYAEVHQQATVNPAGGSMIINEEEEEQLQEAGVSVPQPLQIWQKEEDVNFQETQEADVSVPKPLEIWQKEEQPLDMAEEIVAEPVSDSMPVITSVLTLAYPVLTNLLEPLEENADPYAEVTDLTQQEDDYDANDLAADAEVTRSASEASSGELFTPETSGLAAATFSVDAFAVDEPENLDAEADESRDNGTDVVDDDIIELDSDDGDDGHMDEETEKKLIDLIESDMDEETTAPSEQLQEKTMANLTHYLCPQCGLSCGSLRKWRGHLDAEHGFSDIAKLNMQTIINKDGDLCHQCKTCHHKYRRNAVFSTLFKHCLTHLPFHDYMKCRLCDKRCTTRSQMRNHQLKEHYKICKHYVGTSARNSALYVRFFCPVCGQQQKSRSRWEKHLEEEHDYTAALEDKVKKTDLVDRWECLKCAKEFNVRQKMAHVFTHETHRPFRCKHADCTFDCNTMWLVTHHVRMKHSGGKFVRLCMFCDDKFETQHMRSQHMREKHPRERQKCHVCQKKFRSASLLLSHMNASNHQKLK